MLLSSVLTLCFMYCIRNVQSRFRYTYKPLQIKIEYDKKGIRLGKYQIPSEVSDPVNL